MESNNGLNMSANSKKNIDQKQSIGISTEIFSLVRSHVPAEFKFPGNELNCSFGSAMCAVVESAAVDKTF